MRSSVASPWLAKARTTTPHAPLLEAIGEKLDAEEALADLERTFDFARDPATALERVARVSAVMILERHSAIGRPAAAHGTTRELVISYGNTGSVALYQFVPGDDQVRVLAVRHQREAGYRGE